MPESQSHKRAKAKAAGKGGKTEVPLTRGAVLMHKQRKKRRKSNAVAVRKP